MKKALFSLIDNSIKNVDTYHLNGSTWLIFTETKQWVIEFTSSGTLWYNYGFFKTLFEFVSMDVINDKDYIKDWYESRFIYKPKVEETTKNKVKHTIDMEVRNKFKVEDTIINGVKYTWVNADHPQVIVEDTIQNGVKYTKFTEEEDIRAVEDTIQNGVRGTFQVEFRVEGKVEDIIQNGVRDTKEKIHISYYDIKDTIQNGVKSSGFGPELRQRAVDDTLQNGVKEIKKFGNMPVQYVKDVIQNGVKNTNFLQDKPIGRVEEAIENGVKETHHVDVMKFFDKKMENTLQNGVKETKTPGKDGDLLGFLDFMSDNNTDSIPQLIDDVIVNGVTEDVTEDGIVGVKEAKSDESDINHFIQQYKAENTIEKGIKELKVWKSDRRIKHGYFELVNGYPTYTPMTEVNDVIDNGVKEIYEDPYHHKSRIDGVLKKGDKL